MTPRPELDARVESLIGYRAIGKARKVFLDAVSDPDFVRRCLTRYAEGQAEYDFAYEWLEWDAGRFRDEIGQEIADVVIYTAMQMARANNRQEVAAA